MLESLQHEGKNNFVTLTYAPTLEGGPFNLDPLHTTKWLKRLRKRSGKLRYYLVGEYGDQTQRPHYHVALFGLPRCIGGPVINRECRCVTCSDVRETWGFGHIHVAEFNLKTAQYLCGYVTKKMTQRDNPLLNGRHPEFARMSRGRGEGGIGAAAMHDAASALMQWNLEDKYVDVPLALNWSGRDFPLGRYLRSKLRTYVGHDPKAPAASLKELEEEVSLVRAIAFSADVSTKDAFKEINQPYADTLGVREKMKGRTL